MSLDKRLLNLTMKESENVSSHINIFLLTEKLTETDTVVQEDLFFTMISSLPRSYKQFVITIQTQHTLPSV